MTMSWRCSAPHHGWAATRTVSAHSLTKSLRAAGRTWAAACLRASVRWRRTPAREYVNRVILLSDGLANQGITDPHRLQNIARKQRDHAISLSTIGVGLDYNENLMVGLSENGGGNYYFLESSRNLASVLRKEFDRLGDVVAQNVTIEIELGRGVRLLDAIGYEHSVNRADRVDPGRRPVWRRCPRHHARAGCPSGHRIADAREAAKLVSRSSSEGVALGSFENGIRYETDCGIR